MRTRRESPGDQRPTSRILLWIVVITLAGGWLLYVSLSPDGDDRAYEFPNSNGDFRVRVIEVDGRVCAELKQEILHTISLVKWSVIGQDCAWPAVTGSDAWLAGGLAHQIIDSSSTSVATANWLFYGIAPGTAAEVRLTLSSGATIRIPTLPAGRGGLRVYAHQALDAGDRITVTGVQLRDAQDGEIRVL